MKELVKIKNSDLSFRLNLNYNNVYVRLKSLLGDKASLFADVSAKSSWTWFVDDDAEYRNLADASKADAIILYTALGETLTKVRREIGIDKELSPYIDDILEVPDSSFVFYCETDKGYRFTLTGWGCALVGQPFVGINNIIKNMTGVTDKPVEELQKEATAIEIGNNPAKAEESVVKTVPIHAEDNNVVPSKVQAHESQNEIEDAEDLLEKDEDGEPIYTRSWLLSYTRLRGWLIFFIVILGIGSTINLVETIGSASSVSFYYSDSLAIQSIILAIMVYGIAIYSMVAFISRRSNAVYYSHVYLIVNLIVGLLPLFLGMGAHGIGASIGACIWLIFLHNSAGVEEAIPRSYRHTSIIDWIIGGIVLLFAVLYVFQFQGY